MSIAAKTRMPRMEGFFGFPGVRMAEYNAGQMLLVRYGYLVRYKH
jgi:hypothetical protein